MGQRLTPKKKKGLTQTNKAMIQFTISIRLWKLKIAVITLTIF